MRFSVLTTGLAAVAVTLIPLPAAVATGTYTAPASSSSSAAASPTASSEPGYFTGFSTVSAGKNVTFGANYAVLNLDLINAIVASVNGTQNGQRFIRSTARWIDAVHALAHPPLTVFSRVYFLPGHPEVAADTPFAAALGPNVDLTATSPGSMVYPAFRVLPSDVQLQKVRYYAGAFNELETILRVHKIDTVVISGIRSAGVVMDTIYRLFDADYRIFLIIDNAIEPGDQGALVDQAVKQGIVPKLPANVITLEQALAALGTSG